MPTPTPRRLRPTFRRLLITTDLSAQSDRAIDYGFALARSGASIRLLHVVHPRALPGGQYETELTPGAMHAAHLRSLTARLRARLARWARPRGVAVEALVVEDRRVPEAVCREAARFRADCLVMGSHGVSGLHSIIVGSTTRAVMAACPCPVLVVRCQP